MEKLDVLAEGRRVGAAELTEEGLYLRFTVDCEDVTSGPCRLVGVGDRGELRLGVPEPEGGRLRLSRALSRRSCETKAPKAARSICSIVIPSFLQPVCHKRPRLATERR